MSFRGHSPTSVTQLSKGGYSPSQHHLHSNQQFSPVVQKPYRAHVSHADTLNHTQIDVKSRIKYFRAEQSHGVSTNSGLDLVQVAPILCDQMAPLIPARAPGAASGYTSAASSASPTPLPTQRSPLRRAGGVATGAGAGALPGA